MLSDLDDDADDSARPSVKRVTKAAAGQAPAGAASSVFGLAAMLADKPDLVESPATEAAPRKQAMRTSPLPMPARIVGLMADGEERTCEAIACCLGLKVLTVRNNIGSLVASGHLVRTRVKGEKQRRFRARTAADVAARQASGSLAPKGTPTLVGIDLAPADSEFVVALMVNGWLSIFYGGPQSTIRAGGQSLPLSAPDAATLQRFLDRISEEVTP